MLQTKKKLKKTEYKRLKKLLRHLSAEEQDEGFFFISLFLSLLRHLCTVTFVSKYTTQTQNPKP